MAIDFEKWNQEFGGDEAVKNLEKAEKEAGEYGTLPEGTYTCKLEKLELGESKTGKPMVKGNFTILEGQYKNWHIFYNGVMVANDRSKNGFMQRRVLEFLKSMQVLDDIDVTFDGNFAHFNDLLLDIAEGAEADGLKFEIETKQDGDFSRITITDVFE